MYTVCAWYGLIYVYNVPGARVSANTPGRCRTYVRRHRDKHTHQAAAHMGGRVVGWTIPERPSPFQLVRGSVQGASCAVGLGGVRSVPACPIAPYRDGRGGGRGGSGGDQGELLHPLRSSRCSPSVRQSLRTALEARLSVAPRAEMVRRRAEMVRSREVQSERAR